MKERTSCGIRRKFLNEWMNHQTQSLKRKWKSMGEHIANKMKNKQEELNREKVLAIW